LINRPFASGDIFSRLHNKSLPEWSRDFDCQSWGEFLLKWLLANEAVTCAIPATANVKHLEQNMRAAMGRLPDDKTRQRMVDYVTNL
jgi:aryl-alcohol dehydrogenase-like predicted oxidoreductase